MTKFIHTIIVFVLATFSIGIYANSEGEAMYGALDAQVAMVKMDALVTKLSPLLQAKTLNGLSSNLNIFSRVSVKIHI